jgi:hypothetical protein
MSNLIECPRCGGTGQIKLPERKVEEPKNRIFNKNDVNRAKIAEILFVSDQKPQPPYGTCPDCKGFGKVRG